MKKNYFIIILILSIKFNLSAQMLGTLNPEFHEIGWDTIYGHNNGFDVRKLLIQPDGKVLITAEANFSNEGHQAVIVRYNPNGTLDTSFGGGDGMIRTIQDHPDNWEGTYLFTRATGTALQSNGKIIVAGDQFYNTERILRFNTDGSLDTSFGVSGIIDRNRDNNEFIYHVNVQSDDKIIVCGTARININNPLVQHVFLWRLLPDGSPDSSFGTNGVVTYRQEDWLNGNEIALVVNDLIVLPNDELLVNQTYATNTGYAVWLRKMTANGAPDLSFGQLGNSIKESLGFAVYTYSSSAVQQDGSILSTFINQPDNNLAFNENLYKVNAQGQIDPDFNLILSENIDFQATQATQAKVFSYANLFYVWNKNTDLGINNGFDVLRCFYNNGNLVTSFGQQGTAFINQNDIPISNGGALGIAENGNIFISSVTNSANNGDPVLLTFNVIGATNSLDINEELLTKKLIVYPNPTKGIITISNVDNTTIDKIEVIDMIGKKVITKSGNSTQIDLCQLANGIYIFKIYSGKTVIQKKIIKQ